MLRTPVAEALGAASAVPESVSAAGQNPRDAKGFSFLELNDGSCLGNIQCIVDEGTAAWEKLEGVNTRVRRRYGRTRRVARQGAEMGSAGQGHDRVRPCRS